ncbi:MAG: hybrid sensor histidine kinase/response regulator [Burkholderiaceae bacterium]
MSRLWKWWSQWITRQIEDAEQVRMQFAISPSSPVLGVAAALIATVHYWDKVPKLSAALWFVGVAANHGWYLWLRSRFHQAKPSDEQLPQWAAKHVAGLAVCGLTWGLAAFVFGGASAPHSWNIMLMTLGGTAIIGLLTFTSFFPAHAVFTIGLIAPVTFLSMLRGDAFNYVGAGLALVLLGILLVQGKRQASSAAQVMRTQRENTRLVQQLKQENTAKEQALKDAQDANAAKSRFFSAVSHDVRQPLHSLSLLLETVRKVDAADMRERAVDRMQQSVNMLDSLFTQFLEMSRLDSGVVAPRLEAIALAPLLREVAQTFEQQAASKALRLRVETVTASVHADRALLQRVLTNLLSNAVNYTDQGSVTLACATDGARVRVSVRDTGPGIAQDQQEQVFEEFYRTSHASAATAGFGLGLPIVRRLLRSMGTDVQLQSAPGQGCEFSFVLPAIALAQPQPREPSADDLLAGARVGVIEDDAVAADALKQLFTSWGVHVQVARSAEQALAWQAPMDALITDFQLGSADSTTGVDVVHTLNARWRQVTARETPVLLVSSQSLASSEARGLSVLTKPVSPLKLRSWLLQVLAASRAPG